MKELNDIRKRIDRLDQRLLRLLNARGRLVQDVGQLKNRRRQAIFAPHREKYVLSHLRRMNGGPLSNQVIERVFREIVHACRSLQKQHTIAYFGPEATFTHLAAVQCFGWYARFASQHSIAEVFEEVEKERADYGVVPVENSTEGVVNHTLDMFVDSDLRICAEMELPISHFLLARGRVGIPAVRRLISHPQALAQCRKWVESHLPNVRVVEASSTAEAARMVGQDPHAAAIASRLAADIYRLRVLAPRIEDEASNSTRFLIVGRTAPERTGRDKTSILFAVKDRVIARIADVNHGNVCRDVPLGI